MGQKLEQKVQMAAELKELAELNDHLREAMNNETAYEDPIQQETTSGAPPSPDIKWMPRNSSTFFGLSIIITIFGSAVISIITDNPNSGWSEPWMWAKVFSGKFIGDPLTLQVLSSVIVWLILIRYYLNLKERFVPNFFAMYLIVIAIPLLLLWV
jgi:hypothetical protein